MAAFGPDQVGALNEAKINSKRAADDAAAARAMVEDILTQLSGPKEADGKRLWRGWSQLGGRTLVDAVAGIGAYLGLPGFGDTKKQIEAPKH